MKSLLLKILVVLSFVATTALAQDNYDLNDYDFDVDDADLEVNSFDMNDSGEKGIDDFPASGNDDDFSNYGGVSDFTDDERSLDGEDEGLLNFGEEETGQQSKNVEDIPQVKKTPPPPKTKKKKPQAEIKAVRDDANAVTETPAAVEAPSADNTLIEPQDSSVDYESTNGATQAVANESYEDTPYAPMPEDTMAPPAPDLPPPNDFAGAPAIPGTRRIMAIGEAPETYRVRAGDTLFDICDQLLDEPYYWPKLWALNPRIKNPHFIYPGMMLKFYPGDDDIPPYLQVVREEDIVPLEKGQLAEAELISETMADVLFERFYPKVAPVVYAEEDTSVESFGMEEIGRTSQGKSITVVVPAFYFESEPEVLATVIGSREGWHLSHDGDYFIVEDDVGVGNGSVYSVVRPSEVPEIPEFEGDLGYRYDFVASARVTRSVGEGQNEARVVYTRLGVKPGDILIKYQSVKRSLSVVDNGVTGGGNGTVVGFGYGNQEVGGQGSLVFLSGSFSSGAVVPVFNDTRFLKLNEFGSEFNEVIRPVGKIKIIEAGSNASLGYVVNSTRFIRLGDFTGRG